NGDTTFVYDGKDTTLGYDAGYTMNTNETLLSEGATLQIGSDVLHTADAANKASIMNNNADVVTLAGGATVKSFNIDPQGVGGGIFGTGLGATTVTLDDLNVADNGTKGTQPGLELDTNTGTTTNVSNFTVSNGDGSSATTTDAGVKLNNTGTVNFASTGTISITTNGAAGLDAAAGAGTTSLGSASTFDNITVTNSGNGGVNLAGTTGSGTAFGDGAGNDLQLTTVSGSTPAFSVQTAGSFSVPSGGQSDISATGGPAVDVVSSSGSTMAFDGVSSTNSANDGINIDSIGTGTFSAASGTIGGEAGTGFDLNGGSGKISYPGTFNNGSGSLVAEVTGRSGGTGVNGVTLSGSISDTNDAGGGINVSSNTGGDVTLSGSTKQANTGTDDGVLYNTNSGGSLTLSGGGLAIDTTSGKGLEASNTSATLNVTGSGNTINTTTGRGLNIDTTAIGASNATFDSISSGTNASGPANGIRLNNTGTTGTLFVTGGNGSTADGTGGTIQTTSGNGVDMRGSHKASLEQMNLTNSGDSGSYDDGGELDMNLMNITGAGDAPAAAGNPEAGTTWLNNIGSSSVSNSSVTGSFGNGLDWQPTSGPGTLDVSNSKYNNEGNAGVQVIPPSSANNTTNVDFSYSGGEIKGTPAEGLAATGAGQATVHADVNGVDMANTAANPTNFGVEFNSNTTGHLFARLNNSVIKFAGSSAASAVILDEIQNGQTDVTITNNTIGTPGTNPADIDSGTVGNFGISALFDGDTTNRVDIESNSIAHTDGRPIHLRAHDFSATAGTSNNQITVKNNTMYTPDANNSGITHINGMLVEDEQTNTMCLDATGNHSSHVGTGASDTDIRVSQEDTATFQLEGFAGNGADPAAVSSFLVAQNPTNFAGGTTTASAFIATAFGTSAACTMPTLP
ncbi:MAG: beta strand repeat-containing protein, partial [Thermoleophilaceae bacterium]